ncbi:hypothetical protein THASP1DRAFT_33807 [Thamnocephalis sphaerospora]|uniref:Uncharacterized protein n=1 Tax=Thamnocephalis sphaerospora TaxID=78915 RepID=A0A4P9XFR8_9FUNG|nr:hypothetical protein THASP1DRAFT_33807 [Thamnocephalis sphaerospora]|eukprot:RKP04427.1 hypothetical protein THASP1DRAFT_33807 [Thamnocephalis sphaerospora]
MSHCVGATFRIVGSRVGVTIDFASQSLDQLKNRLAMRLNALTEDTGVDVFGATVDPQTMRILDARDGLVYRVAQLRENGTYKVVPDNTAWRRYARSHDVPNEQHEAVVAQLTRLEDTVCTLEHWMQKMMDTLQAPSRAYVPTTVSIQGSVPDMAACTPASPQLSVGLLPPSQPSHSAGDSPKEDTFGGDFVGNDNSLLDGLHDSLIMPPSLPVLDTQTDAQTTKTSNGDVCLSTISDIGSTSHRIVDANGDGDGNQSELVGNCELAAGCKVAMGKRNHHTLEQKRRFADAPEQPDEPPSKYRRLDDKTPESISSGQMTGEEDAGHEPAPEPATPLAVPVQVNTPTSRTASHSRVQVVIPVLERSPSVAAAASEEGEASLFATATSMMSNLQEHCKTPESQVEAPALLPRQSKNGQDDVIGSNALDDATAFDRLPIVAKQPVYCHRGQPSAERGKIQAQSFGCADVHEQGN